MKASITKKMNIKSLKFHPLSLFRIGFGITAFVEISRYILNGWVDRFFVEPTLHLPWPGFFWVKAMPSWGMHTLFYVLGVTSILFAAGAFFRIVSWIWCLGWTYLFLIDICLFQNHVYLITLLSLLFCFSHAHYDLSWDAKRLNLNPKNIPGWELWLFRFQWACVFFYGGINKIHMDWLTGRTVTAMGLYKQLHFLPQETAVSLLSIGGLIFDLTIAPLLLWSRTRWFAMAACGFFHVTNHFIFSQKSFMIGVFPLLSIFALLLFLPHTSKWAFENKYTKCLVSMYIIGQIILPLRHFMIPGDQLWTREGSTFAWNMKSRSVMGYTQMAWRDEDNQQFMPIDLTKHFKPFQLIDIYTTPQITWIAAQSLKDELNKETIYANTLVSLNKRNPSPIISHISPITDQKWNWFTHNTWIILHPDLQ